MHIFGHVYIILILLALEGRFFFWAWSKITWCQTCQLKPFFSLRAFIIHFDLIEVFFSSGLSRFTESRQNHTVLTTDVVVHLNRDDAIPHWVTLTGYLALPKPDLSNFEVNLWRSGMSELLHLMMLYLSRNTCSCHRHVMSFSLMPHRLLVDVECFKWVMGQKFFTRPQSKLR
jgi:hypothetical protein